jgi:hypothetical protein
MTPTCPIERTAGFSFLGPTPPRPAVEAPGRSHDLVRAGYQAPRPSVARRPQREDPGGGISRLNSGHLAAISSRTRTPWWGGSWRLTTLGYRISSVFRAGPLIEVCGVALPLDASHQRARRVTLKYIIRPSLAALRWMRLLADRSFTRQHCWLSDAPNSIQHTPALVHQYRSSSFEASPPWLFGIFQNRGH